MVKVSETALKACVNCEITKYPELQDEYDKIRIIEKLITPNILKIAEQNGTEFAGLENSAKTATSIEDKVERIISKYYGTPENALNSMTDLIRYTQLCDHDSIFDVAKKTIAEMEAQGYKLSKINNYYINNYPNTGYKGLHMNFLTPYGKTIEMQIHSPFSFDVKQKGHDMYDKIRAVSTPLEEKEALEPVMRELHGQVKDPPGYMNLKDYTIDPEDKKKYLDAHPVPQITIQKLHGNNISAMIYSVVNNEKPLLSGFEIHQSDGSVLREAKYEGEKQKVHASAITNAGILTKSCQFDDPNFLQNLESVLQIGNVNEFVNMIWGQNGENRNMELSSLPDDAWTMQGITTGVNDKNKDLLWLSNRYSELTQTEEAIKQVALKRGCSRSDIMKIIGENGQNLKKQLSKTQNRTPSPKDER